jgi:two-component system chemotaxis response regulator CheY
VLPAAAAPPRILVADADADMRALYRDTFTVAGYEVVEASDGRDALVRALMHPPVLVLTELRLPLMDGFALCEILRRDRTTAAVPILVETTETRPTELERARQAGADVVLTKPTPAERLLSEVQRLVVQSEALRERSAAARAKAAKQMDKASDLLAKSEQQRRIPARVRVPYVTTTPPEPPPELTCPSCRAPLTYKRSHIGGVSNHAEQWDEYVCRASCGNFQFRHRTRELRRVSC